MAFDPLQSLVGITSDANGVIGGIWLDAVVRELHTMRNKATRHPLESGADVVDHVISEPDSVVLECKVTNSPIRVPQSHAAGAQPVEREIDVPSSTVDVLGLQLDADIALGFGSVGLNATAKRALVKFIDGARGRVDEVYAELQAIMAAKRVVDIRTSLRDYTDMIIEDVSAPVGTGEGGRVLNFSVTAVSIRTASSRIVDAPVPTQKRAEKSQDAGVQPAQNADEQDVGAEKASVLHGLFF